MLRAILGHDDAKGQMTVAPPEADEDSARRGRFIGCRKDGLGARLLLMLNCFKLSEQFNATALVYWPQEDSLATNMEHPEKLFSSGMMDEHFISRAVYEDLRKSSTPLWRFLSDKTPSRLRDYLRDGGTVLVEEGFEVVLFPWEDEEAVRATYRGFFNAIALTPVLQERRSAVDTVLAAGAGGSVAYHLRRGDILDTPPWKHTVWPSKVEPDEYYEAHLRKTPEKTAIIFSDSDASVDRLKAKFPALLAVPDIVELEGLAPIQRDFLELYAMSRVDQIVAPTLSAFSTAAARIAGKQRLRFRDVLTAQELDDANAVAVHRLQVSPQSYINASEAAHAYSRVAFHLARPDDFDTGVEILRTIKQAGADNAFVDIYLAVGQLYNGNCGDAAAHARAAAASPDIWPEDFASAKAIEAVCYGASGQRKKAGRVFREAFLFKPMRQDVVLAGTNLIRKHLLNKHNFLPYDHHLLRHLKLSSKEDRASSYLAGKVINKLLRRDLRFIALDWHDLVLDGKASRLKEDTSELTAMLRRLEHVDPEKIADHTAAFEGTKGQVLCYLGDGVGLKLIERAILDEPANPLNMMRLANAKLKLKDPQAALDLLSDAQMAAPENPFYAHKLGLTLADAGRTDHAMEVLAKAAKSDNATAKVLADFAMFAWRAGEADTAEATMRRALERIPVFKRFQNQMRRITKSR